MKNWQILHRGIFDGIEITVVPEKRTYSQKILEQIDLEWERAIEKNPGLYNGIAFSLLDSSVGDRTLHLLMQETDYKSFYGTNATHASDLTDPNDRSDILAACCVCVTSDRKVIVGKRSNLQAQGAGRWHVIGGNLDILDPYQLMQREVVEETGIDPECVEAMECMALGLCVIGKKPELLFHARLNCDSDYVRGRLPHAFDAEEHTEMRFVPVEELLCFVEENPMVPVGEAAIAEYLNMISSP